MPQGYRNARKGYLTDILTDTTPIGAIVTNLKAGQNSYDHSFVKATSASYPSLSEAAGNSYNTGDDPAYTHEGYLYCDGTEYNIGDYPGLYQIVGTKYGGRSSNGIDVSAGGSGYTLSSAVTVTAAPTGGTNIVASVGSVDGNGAILTINVTNVGGGYTSLPTVTVAGGTGATFVVRMTDLTAAGGASVQPITTANVIEWWGDPYLGKFKVPDMIAKKVVGNGPVYGSNSPTIGNASMAVGVVGGAWYLDKNQQDRYFSLGRIVTSGYEKVIETTGCTIIGSQDVTITMREKKLSGVPQHSHIAYHSVPGDTEWIGGTAGDRYLQDYRPGTGRISRWYPTGDGIVMTHKHGLLRRPLSDNTVATYDALDYAGGAGGNGGTQDPTSEFANGATGPGDYYLASGAAGSGNYEYQVTIPNPITKKFATTSVIGGKEITSGGTPIYDYSNEWEWDTPGNRTIDLTAISGTPDRLIYTLYGAGGSGAAGTQAGNDGGDTYMKVGSGSVVHLIAEGGKKGNGSSGLGGGTGGAAGSFSSSGSTNPGGGSAGIAGSNGQNGTAGNGWPEADYPNNPNGGGAGGAQTGTFSDGSSGINVLVGGQSGTSTQEKTEDGNFTFSGINNPTSITFEIHGGKGKDGFYGNRPGGFGGKVNLSVSEFELDTFSTATWSCQIGPGATSRTGAQTSSAGDGGDGGWGWHEGNPRPNGGGGGAATALLRNGTVVAGAGGGGGGGGDGFDGGSGTGGQGNPLGGIQEASGTIGAGMGGAGGNWECQGGGGGGGGGGIGTPGQITGGVGNGGGSGGIGGGPGGDGRHGGGAGGNQGISSYIDQWFETGTLTDSTLVDGKVIMSVVYNNDYWTPGGGGAGAGGKWNGNTQFAALGSPASIEVEVGTGGAGVSMSGQTTGTTANGGSGYAKIGLGTITGYSGGNTTISTGDIISAASYSATVDDVSIKTNGGGTGTAGGFKLPTADPIVLIRGGGGTGATAVPVITGGLVTGINVTNGGSGYTETPYVHVLHGQSGGTIATATLGTGGNSDKVDSIAVQVGSSTAYTNYLLFGGAHNTTTTGAKTRWVELHPVDTSDATHFSIKAARGNGVNGGDYSEESLLVYYQVAGSTTWVLIDTIIQAYNTARTDDFIGNVPAANLNTTWDGASGDTKWYTYTITLPQNAKAAGTKFKLEQVRADSSSTNDNDQNTDHLAICEFLWWNGKSSQLIFVQTAGKMLKTAVDSLTYTVQGEVGPSITYSSGLGCSDATLTLKSTTKIEPQATIDPDKHIPLLHSYRTCKYLIKAY